jgi:hypothetical protein
MNNRDDISPELIEAARTEKKRRMAERAQKAQEAMQEQELKKNSLFNKFGLEKVPEDVRDVGAGLMSFGKSAAQPYAAIYNKLKGENPPDLFGFAKRTPGLTPYQQFTEQTPEENADELPSIDPYKLAGTKKKPLWDEKGINVGGIEQATGEYGPDAIAIFQALRAFPHIARSAIDLFRPEAYARRLAQENVHGIQHEFTAAQGRQGQAYDVPHTRYGQALTTNNPVQYLGYSRSQMRYFGPEARRLYDEFVASPTMNNLHRFQSQLGNDAVKKAERFPYTAQSLRQSRQTAQQRLEQFLQSQNDPEALAAYQEGQRITREEVEPMRSTKKLRKVTNRKINEMDFNELQRELEKAMETGTNVLNRQGQITSQVGGVPEGNYLRDLLERMNYQGRSINQRRIFNKILKKLGGGAITGLGLYEGYQAGKSYLP